ncbi:MAG TPA: hypothetical protein VIV40_39815, partial [Kofleriaceae bacterium]
GYTKLIGRTWSLTAGQTDIYRCLRLTIPTDMYVTDIQAQAPNGTPHTVLSIAGANGTGGADGEQDCSVQTLGMVMLYASGVGTSPLNFPSGVGVKIAAGTQIHLNLHLYNAADEAISGESAIWVKSQPTPTPTLAEMVFAGPIGQWSIDPGADTMQGTCSITKAYTIFALWPHMHKLATEQKIELVRGGVTTVLHDMPYQFAEQKYWLQSPEIQLQANDKINVTCYYNNTTGGKVYFGDSSDDEMCFGGMYRYPAANSSLFCPL